MRGAFRLSPNDDEAAIARKLEESLKGLGLASSENLGLLLNLLGLKAPEGVLEGLDGVLVGLRTRDMLRLLVKARCRLTPMIMAIEDLPYRGDSDGNALSRAIELLQEKLKPPGLHLQEH